MRIHTGLVLSLCFVLFPKLIHAALDTDADGLGDVWQARFDMQNANPQADDDGDGRTNEDEFKAGTDPKSSTDYLYVYDLEFTSTDGVIKWPTVKGKYYQLQESNSLAENSWNNLGPLQEGVDGLLSYNLTMPTAIRFFRIAVSDADSDSDGVTDWEELQLQFNPHDAYSQGPGGDAAALVDALTLESTFTIDPVDPSASEAGLDKAHFIITRTGGLHATTLFLQIDGTATPVLDYTALPTQINFVLGQRTADLWITPIPDELVEGSEDVIATIRPDSTYNVGTGNQAIAQIYDPATKLFLSALRPATAADALGYGTGSVLLSQDRLSAQVSLFLSNLTTPQVACSLVWKREGHPDLTVKTLDVGQIVNEGWDFTTAPQATSEELATALEAGELFFSVATNRYASDELGGGLIAATAPRPMPIPPAPPVVDLVTPPTVNEAARFLTQATFGPDLTSIAEVQSLGYEGWIDAQMALPATYHLPYIDNLIATAADPKNTMVYQNQRQEIWWQSAITGPDQLRQRVAWALSQIFVASDQSSALTNEVVGLTVYYDLLLRNSFGNYRTLLNDVTLSPVMGNYLSHLKNAKPDPVTGTTPDENYAREVMQLFSIGLVKLHQDGTVILDDNGLPVPTYLQPDVFGMAHVFTGWSWNDPTGTKGWKWGASDYRNPMSMYPSYHDTGAKAIIDGVILPAGQTGEKDLQDTLDILYNHPNTGPFICHKLIQRLVTSNPSPGYLYRVSQVFSDNGHGVRGDLGAVVKAILLDYEARGVTMRTDQAYGKQREPIITAANLFRAFHASAATGLWRIWNAEKDLGQAALRSPTVFNFYEPYYQQPGQITDNGVLSPEMQITTETTAIVTANYMNTMIYSGISSAPNKINLDITYEKTLANSPGDLLDHLNTLLLYGSMTSEMRQSIITAVTAQTSNIDDTQRTNRARAAIHLIATSPEFTIQR